MPSISEQRRQIRGHFIDTIDTLFREKTEKDKEILVHGLAVTLSTHLSAKKLIEYINILMSGRKER
jgi:hypothetical protein